MAIVLDLLMMLVRMAIGTVLFLVLIYTGYIIYFCWQDYKEDKKHEKDGSSNEDKRASHR